MQKNEMTTITDHTQKPIQNGLDLKVRPETIKILEENIGSMLFEMGLSNIFLAISPQAREKNQNI